MRFLPFSLFLAVSLFASPKEIQSFYSPFEQRIMDEHGKCILYRGELWASKPQNALWSYQKPIQKSVYINGNRLTVIEPQIEQAIIRSLGDEIDFLEIIKKAKQKNSEHYTATVNGQLYTITVKNDVLRMIHYTDPYDNRVTIQFLNPVQNGAISPSRFQPSIPKDFDIIKN